MNEPLADDQSASVALGVDQIDVLLHSFYDYYKGPAPRAGAHVRHSTGHRYSTILGVSPSGRAFGVCDDCGSIRYGWHDDMVLERGLSRLSLSEVFSAALAVYRLETSCPFPGMMLACLFNGNYGERYRNIEALAWAVAGALRPTGMYGPGLAKWASETCAELGNEPGRCPPVLMAFAQHVEGEPFPAFDPDRVECTDRAILVGHEQLEALRDHVLPAAVLSFDSRAICFNESSASEVAVVGPAIGESDPGWFDVFDLESGGLYAIHGDDLDPYDEKVGERDFATLFVDAVENGIPLAMQRLLLDESPLPMPDPVTRTLLGGALLRTALPNSGAARAGYRAMATAYKCVDKADRKTLCALLPELVNPKAKADHQPMGPAGRVLAAWVARARDLLPPDVEIAAPDPAPSSDLSDAAVAVGNLVKGPSEDLVAKVCALEATGQSESVKAEAPEAMQALESLRSREQGRSSLEPESQVPEVVPSDSPTVQTPAVAPAKPSVGAPIKPLRFKIVEHQLLAQEWALAAVDGAYGKAVSTTLSWLSKRIGITLPAHWKTGGHEIEQAGVSLQIEAASPVFAFRLEHPDTSMPTRTWRAEGTIIVGAEGVGGMVGVRLSALDRTELPLPTTSVPQLVREWLQSPGLLVADLPANQRRIIDTDEAIDAFRAVAEAPGRDGPLIVLDAERPANLPAPIHGLALVYLLDPCKRTTYSAAFRRLEPGKLHMFAPGTATPAPFPVSPPGLQQLLDGVIQCRQRPTTPTFRNIRDEVREAGLHQARPAPTPTEPSAQESGDVTQIVTDPCETPSAITALAMPDVPEPPPASSSYAQLQELFEMALQEKADASLELDARRRELETANEQVRALKAKLHALSAALGDKSSLAVPVAPAIALPTSLAELPNWSESLSPRVVVTEKALRLASRTEHREVAQIYSALEALRDLYWPMRWSDDQSARERWLQFLESNRMKCSPTGTALDTSRYADEYTAQIGGRSIPLTMHVQGSSTRDPLRCVRIYFCPDDTTQQVVIGHLPTHLTNRHT